MLRLTGLSAFPITPADPDGRVDTAALRRLLGRLAATEVDSIGLLGSTGTYAYLSRAERRRTVEAAAAEVGGRTPLLVGVGALRTDEAVRLAQDARAAGADAGLLAAMSYTPLSEDEVFEHVVTVAREGGLPLCLYDNPATTHFRFTPALVGRLSREPGIVAVKSPGAGPAEVARDLAALRAVVPDGVALGTSGDWFAAEALLAGAATWYSVAAGLFPEPCLAITRAAQDGDAAGARRLNDALAPLWDLFKAHSSLRVIYAAAAMLDLCHAAPPRPILPLPAPVREQVAAVVRQLGLE
ncbi:MAG: dihydrodipicolinate synthase family protein [Methylobacterium frigidaeris]